MYQLINLLAIFCISGFSILSCNIVYTKQIKINTNMETKKFKRVNSKNFKIEDFINDFQEAKNCPVSTLERVYVYSDYDFRNIAGYLKESLHFFGNNHDAATSLLCDYMDVISDSVRKSFFSLYDLDIIQYNKDYIQFDFTLKADSIHNLKYYIWSKKMSYVFRIIIRRQKSLYDGFEYIFY